MASSGMDYHYVTTPQMHLIRAKQILKDYPEVKALFGPSPFSGPLIVSLVCLQLTMAYYLQESSLGMLALMAFVFGAFPNHALYGQIHECTHNLVVRSTVGNRLWGIICDIPLVVPSAMGFRKYHLYHHRHLGEYEYDPDLVSFQEAKLVGHSRVKKTLWLTFFFLSQGIFRPLRLKKIIFWDKWILINLLFIVVSNGIILFLLGPKALLYLFLSTFFALGLHPLGGRWIQEHYTLTPHPSGQPTHRPDANWPVQETFSYYGPLNYVNFNLGYHNEHHDLPMVPWNHLPKLKKMAAPYYDSLYSHRSLLRVLFSFIWNRRHSPLSRIVHPSFNGSKNLQQTAYEMNNEKLTSTVHGEETEGHQKSGGSTSLFSPSTPS